MLSEVVVSLVVFIPLFALLAVVSDASGLNLLLMLLASVAVLISLTAMSIRPARDLALRQRPLVNLEMLALALFRVHIL